MIFKSVSVIIPNYNGVTLLIDNLPSVIREVKQYSIVSGKDTEIIIADDNSTDSSIEFLEKNYPEIILVKGDKNLGFSGNINRAIKRARYELVLLVNNDAYINSSYIAPLLDYFQDSQTFGVVGAVMHQGVVTDSIKVANVSPWNQIMSTHNFNSPKKGGRSLFLTAACALVDRKKLLELNGFCELYSPFYVEDVDLGIRALRMGWNNYYDPTVSCIHPPSQTVSKFKRKYVKLISRRNRFILHHIHLGQGALLIWYAKVCIDLVSRWLVFDLQYYKSWFLFMKCFTKVQAERRLFLEQLRKRGVPGDTIQILRDLYNDQKKFVGES